MSNAIVTLLSGALCAASLRGELGFLTRREALSIVERIPAVAAAREKGECPQFSPTYGGDELWVQFRGGCGPTTGWLMDNYVVNLRTGDVTSGGDERTPVLFRADADALIEGLVQQARDRTLSLSEARCLALEAAKALPGWSDKGSTVSVRSFGRPDRREAVFIAEHQSAAHPVANGLLLTVDRKTTRVRNDDTGMDLMSAGIGSLTAKLLALRTPPWLTDEDAAIIALAVPAVAARVPAGCRLDAAGVFNSDVVAAVVSCNGQPRGGAVIVNVRTGQVVDDESRKILKSDEAERLARQILHAREMQLSNLRKEIEVSCGHGREP